MKITTRLPRGTKVGFCHPLYAQVMRILRADYTRIAVKMDSGKLVLSEAEFLGSTPGFEKLHTV